MGPDFTHGNPNPQQVVQGWGWLWEVMRSQAGAPLGGMGAPGKGPQRALRPPPRGRGQETGQPKPGGVPSPDLGPPRDPGTGETRVCRAEAPSLWFLAVAAGTDPHSPLSTLGPGDAFRGLKGRLGLLGGPAVTVAPLGEAQDHRACLGFPVAGLAAALQQTLLSRAGTGCL